MPSPTPYHDGSILAALSAPRHGLIDSLPALPPCPGLYAIHTDDATWVEVGLGAAPDDRPLYVGKAEDSLLARDIKTHFGDGRTGSSTLRRSFAALLRATLQLRARPRNPAKPERFANYGLSSEHDARLTACMREHLKIAVWPKVADVALADVEREVLRHWSPPLNLSGVSTQWTRPLKQARAVMAAEAAAWPSRGEQ